MNKLLFKILQTKQSYWQIIIAGGGLWLGLVILLLSVQIYYVYNNYQTAKKSDKDNYYYFDISKTIDMANTMGAKSDAFSQAEIDSLKKQPFITDVAAYTQSNFKMDADLQISVDIDFNLVFESLPNAFLDTVPEEFVWDENGKFIPVMIYGGYLNLYNSSIAKSQGLPQIPQSLLKMVPFKVTLKGNGKTESRLAKVVGFSDRISLLAVPEGFMQWANDNYGVNTPELPSKLMLKVEDPGAKPLKAYLQENAYTTDSEKLKSDNSKQLLSALVLLLAFIGGLFLSLSFIIFIINFQLILAKAKEDLGILFNLGYTYNSINRILTAQFSMVLLIIIASAIVAILIIAGAIHSYLAEKGFNLTESLSSTVYTISIGLFVMLLLLNVLSIKLTLRA